MNICIYLNKNNARILHGAKTSFDRLKQRCKNNGYRIYVDIMTGEKLFFISVAFSHIIHWSVSAFCRRGGGNLYFSLLPISLY